MKTEPCKKQESYRLKPEIAKRLAKASKRENRTKTAILETALAKYLGIS